VPYESLGAELTPDYKERTNIFVIRTYVQQTFNLGIMWIFPFATWLAAKPFIHGEIGGVRAVSWLIGAMIVVAGILPALFCVERYSDIAARQEQTGNFKTELKALLANKPLMIVIGIICTYLLAIIATMNLAYFVNTYYVYGGSIHSGAKLGAIDGTLRFGFALLGAWVIKKLQNKYDKHHMMMACVVTLLVAFTGIIFTTIPGRPWLTLTMKPLLAFGEVGFWILIMSMRADVCDWDELKCNRRREGLIAAATNWFTKMTIAAAMLMAGLLLESFVRFDSKLDDVVIAKIEAQAAVEFAGVSEEAKAGKEAEHGTWVRVVKALGSNGTDLSLSGRMKEALLNGDVAPVTLDTVTDELKNRAIMEKQSPGTMRRLLYSYTIPQIIALIIAFFLLLKYPLTHERLSSIRKDLEERRGKTLET
jgi:Na+/melibiose symporter-like transporter